MSRDVERFAIDSLGALARGIAYALLIAPPIIVIGASFTTTSTLRFPPQGFTLRWYQAALANPEFTSAIWNSLVLGWLTMVSTTAIALAAALAIDRHRFPGRQALLALVMTPLAIPAVALGLALLVALSSIGLNRSLVGLLGAHIVITLPFAVRTLLASLALFDRALEEAAASLRAGPWRTLRRVTLPLLLPGLVSAMMLAFVISFGNVIVTMLLASSGFVTLPVQMVTYVEVANDPSIAAVSSLVIVLTAIVMLGVEMLFGLDRTV